MSIDAKSQGRPVAGGFGAVPKVVETDQICTRG